MNEIVENTQTNQNPKSKFIFIKRILYVVIGIIVIMAFVRSINPDNSIVGIDSMREAYSAATEIVSKQFSSETEMDFPKFNKDFIIGHFEKLTYEGEEYHVYTVSSYVDFKNIFGTDSRNEYVVKVGLPTNKENDNYYYEIISDSLGIFEQTWKTSQFNVYWINKTSKLLTFQAIYDKLRICLKKALKGAVAKRFSIVLSAALLLCLNIIFKQKTPLKWVQKIRGRGFAT